MSGSALDLSIPSLFNVKGKIALVTGGGSGIGEMMATALVQNGAKVYIASRKEKQLKEVSEALNKKGPGTCSYLVADLSSKAGCDSLAEQFKAKEDKLHILINNSGASWGAPFDNVPEKEGWDKIMNLNVKSIFYLTSNFSELLAKDATPLDPGRVINISSTASIRTVAKGTPLSGENNGLWSYHASKAAVNHLTATLAATLIHRYITVNAILPGVFPSRMTAYGFRTANGAFERDQPTGRVGHPTDIGGVMLFLVSSASAHVTGAMIIVDGGQLITNGPFAKL